MLDGPMLVLMLKNEYLWIRNLKSQKIKKYNFLQIEPTPTAKEITKFYSDEFYSGDFKKFNDSSLEVQLEDKDFYEENWENIFQNIKKISKQNADKDISILDVGCGWGLALEFLKKGFNALVLIQHQRL